MYILSLFIFTAFNLVSSDSKGLIGDYELERLDTVTVTASHGRFVQLLSDELLMDGEPGDPPRYYYKLMFALPQTGGFSVKVIPFETEELWLPAPLAPVPEFEEDGLSEVYRQSKAYTRDYFLPTESYKVLRTGIMDNIRYAEVAIFPIKYNPQRNLLIVQKRLRVKISFDERPVEKSVSSTAVSEVARLNLVNFDIAKSWTVERTKLNWEDPFSIAPVWVKVAIVDEGVYEITYDDIQKLGIQPVPSNRIVLMSFGGRTLPSDVDSANVGMRQVGFLLEDGGDGEFGPGDKLLFYGLPMQRYQWDGEGFEYFNHPYSDTNFYWLGLYAPVGEGVVLNPIAPSQGAELDTVIRFYRHEKELFNIAQKGLWWLGEMIQRNAGERTAYMDFTFDLPGLADENGEIRIQVVGGYKYQTRDITVILNGDTLGQLNIVGLMARSLDVQYSRLRATGNTLRILVSATLYDTTWRSENDYVFLDFFDVRYRALSTSLSDGDVYFEGDSGHFSVRVADGVVQAWKVTDPLMPEIHSVQNGKFDADVSSGDIFYLQKSTIRPVYISLFPVKHLRNSDVTDVRYLAVVAREFSSVFRDYARWRSQNLLLPSENMSWDYGEGRVLTVTAEDIFNEFGFGIRDPVAIRNFVRYVYDNDDSLIYLTLVGDGHYDYKGYSTTFGNFIPPYEPFYLLNIESQLGANDAFFADMDGDRYPDLLIGRIPVRYRSELGSYIEKVCIYESGAATGLWRDRVMLVADDEYGENQNVGGDVQHMYYINLIYNNWIPHSMDVSHVYEIEFPRPAPRVRKGASEAFIREFNRGSSMLVIFIHGHPAQLSHEKLFDLQRDAGKINAGRKNPFVFVASCKVGGFDRIIYPRSITEDWTLRPGGAIATVSSTVGEFHSTNMRVFEGMVTLLRADSSRHPFGEMLVNGIANSSGYYFVLFGDPSIPYSFVYPRFSVTMTDTLRRGDRVSWVANGISSDQPGFVYVNALGVRKLITYHSPDGVTVINYTRPPDPYFVGKSVVDNDSAHGVFWVPVTVDTGNTANTIIYSPDNVFGEAGIADNRSIVRENGIIIDTTGATIELVYKGRKLVSGDTIRNRIQVEIKVVDNLGINLTREVRANEPGLSLWYSYSSTPVDLTPAFEYDLNSDTSGAVYTTLNFPGTGDQTLTVREYDSYENVTSKRWDFFVAQEDRLSITDFLVYPNPVTENIPIKIGFDLSIDASVRVSIWTVSGRKIWDSGTRLLPAGYNEIVWDGKDMDGEMPANGLYFVSIEAEANGVHKTYVQRFALAR